LDPELLEGWFQKKIHVAIIPESCTPLVQPNDTHINRPFKVYLREQWTNHQVKRVNARNNAKSVEDLAEMRELVVSWVALAIAKISPELVRKAFQECGLSLDLEGNEEHLCKVDLHPFLKLYN
jgi:hypothetical protein